MPKSGTKTKNQILTDQEIVQIEQAIDYSFRNKATLCTAFVHSSYANEKGQESNERLEFLGDSILNFLSTEILFFDTSIDEGKMTVLKSQIVSREPLCGAVKDMGLEQFLRSSVGEASDNMCEDLFEALVAAIYVDSRNLEYCKAFIKSSLKAPLKMCASELGKKPCDYKTQLQERMQKKGVTIAYQTLEKLGTDHAPQFVIAVQVNGVEMGRGTGKTKKEAGQAAARAAVEGLKS